MDENFPQPILAASALQTAITGRLSIEVKRLQDIGPDLFGENDDDLIRALDTRGAEALLTCDDDMLFLPEVQRAILDTGFSIVTVRGGTSDPIMATGVLLAHLREIVTDHRRGRDQVWRLGTRQARPMSVAELLAQG